MVNVSIECIEIKKTYGQNETLVEALKGINLKIYDNQLTLLAGPSGSGKTTLLSIITTILTPDSGELILLGHKMSEMSDDQKATFCRNNLGVVFQSLFLIPTLTVVENVTLPLLIGGDTEQTAKEKAMGILEKMKISHKANVSPSNLSKGQQQRVAIARAMVNNSKIIVCDEPTSALDHTAGFAIMALLKELSASQTVLVVTHDHRIFTYADRIINMSDGQITSEESPINTGIEHA